MAYLLSMDDEVETQGFTDFFQSRTEKYSAGLQFLT